MISWQAQYFRNMFPFAWKSRRKCSFWKSRSAVFEKVSHKTLVLEVRIFSSWKSRIGRFFWSSGCKISVSGSCGTTCARSLCEDPLDHLYQDPVGALVQDLCSKIFWPTVAGSYRRTSARSLYQDPVGQLVQDLCFRISV